MTTFKPLSSSSIAPEEWVRLVYLAVNGSAESKIQLHNLSANTPDPSNPKINELIVAVRTFVESANSFDPNLHRLVEAVAKEFPLSGRCTPWTPTGLVRDAHTPSSMRGSTD